MLGENRKPVVAPMRHGRRVLKVILAFTAACLLTATSQSAAPPPAEFTHSPAAPAPDLRGTEQRPLVVEQIPAPKRPSDVAREDAEAAARTYHESVTAYATLGLTAVTALLAIFTFLLWYANRKLVLGAETTAERQAREMQASIAEATRSATAVEQLAEATKRNASLMSDILHKQMRAYLAIQPGGGVYQDEHNSFGSYPVILNTGLSPARNVSHRVAAAILDANTPRDYPFPDPPMVFQNDATLAAHQSFTLTAVVQQRYEADEVAAIMKGDNRRLFVWGIVTYDDVFGGHWETRFCHHFIFYKVGEDVKVNSWYHSGHNSTT